jgi:hypothetical protein
MSLDVWLTMEIDTSREGPEQVEFYSANITHNLNHMAEAAGIYYHLWRPEEIGIKTAGELIEPLGTGLAKMKADPEYYKQFDAENGWGVYDDFVPWIERYIEACKKHPKTTIWVSR